jgi:hypothetical protein
MIRWRRWLAAAQELRAVRLDTHELRSFTAA